MADKENSRDTPYQHREDTEPHKQSSHYINERNNNTNDETPSAIEPNVERANDTEIGDSGWNDAKMTNYTENHSSDA